MIKALVFRIREPKHIKSIAGSKSELGNQLLPREWAKVKWLRSVSVGFGVLGSAVGAGSPTPQMPGAWGHLWDFCLQPWK